MEASMPPNEDQDAELDPLMDESDEDEGGGGWEDEDVPERRPPPRRLAKAEPFDFEPALLGLPTRDPDAREREWHRVIEHFNPRLDDFFAFDCPDPDKRNEVLSHIWRAALVRLPTLRSSRAGWSYLLKVGQNYLRDQWGAEARASRFLERYARHMAVEEDLQLSMRTVLERLSEENAGGSGWPIEPEELEVLLGQLSYEERELVTLRHVHGLNHEEVAERLGIKSATARKRYSRILKFLRGEA
jgi:RNA polymerase sigma factor (sigma-70 family)